MVECGVLSLALQGKQDFTHGNGARVSLLNLQKQKDDV
jgi:hypothetical protein